VEFTKKLELLDIVESKWTKIIANEMNNILNHIEMKLLSLENIFFKW